MDCMNARLLLLFNRPGCAEIASEDMDSLQDHLEHCAECRSVAHKEKMVDGVLGSALRKVPLPGGLQERIQQRLVLERRPRPWIWLATAASLLLMVGLTVSWYLQPSPTIDAGSITNLRPGSSPESVTAWFRERGLTLAIPPEFDFHYLDSWEVVSLQGQRVPKLLFINQGVVAHVYVISTDQFQYDEELHQRLLNNSLNAVILHHPDNADFFFLVINSGGTLDSFQRRGV
jgi:hypothetical protein